MTTDKMIANEMTVGNMTTDEMTVDKMTCCQANIKKRKKNILIKKTVH